MRYLNAKSDKQREAAKSDLEQRFWVGAVLMSLRLALVLFEDAWEVVSMLYQFGIVMVELLSIVLNSCLVLMFGCISSAISGFKKFLSVKLFADGKYA